MSIYFVRHIKTVYNQLGLISGCAEAEILPNQSLIFNSELPKQFDLILSSTLSRCRETIKLLSESSYSKIIYTDILLERNVGILEGLSKSDAINRYPQLFTNGKIDVNALIPDGESIFDVIERIRDIADFLKNKDPSLNILVCSHNQTLKVLFSLLCNITLDNSYWLNFNFKNGTVVNIEDIIIP